MLVVQSNLLWVNVLQKLYPRVIWFIKVERMLIIFAKKSSAWFTLHQLWNISMTLVGANACDFKCGGWPLWRMISGTFVSCLELLTGYLTISLSPHWVFTYQRWLPCPIHAQKNKVTGHDSKPHVLLTFLKVKCFINSTSLFTTLYFVFYLREKMEP